MKYLSLLSVFLLFSCGNKEDILLPKSNVTIVKDVEDHSPIYIFFRKNGKDTLAAVNRKNEIISTNWIFNIDKRLPLRLVLPEVMKLQEKKRNEVVHKNEAAQNYYSYADSIGKNLAFIPFTDVYYKLEKPKVGKLVFFDKKNQIWIDNVAVIREELVSYLNKQSNNSATKILFCYDKDLLFGSYVQDKIFIKILKINSNSKEEFIY
jgi:hypothetical protein